MTQADYSQFLQELFLMRTQTPIKIFVRSLSRILCGNANWWKVNTVGDAKKRVEHCPRGQ